MPIVTVNAAGEIPVTEGPEALEAALDRLAPGAPVLILLHGFRYSPSDPSRSPHEFIFAPATRNNVPSWPRRMGFGRGQPGLCIPFGWEADSSLWRAYAEAGRAGVALAALITRIRARHDGPVNLLAHSLGARVALATLPHLAPGDVARMVLLAAGEFSATARDALQSPAGRRAEVLNVTSRENDLYDFLFERLLAPLSLRAPVLGAGLDLPNCLTLQLDAPEHRQALRLLGFRLAPARHLICHWSAYLRPGVFPFYRALLLRPEALPFALLRATLPATQSPRWSRLRTAHLYGARIAVQ